MVCGGGRPEILIAGEGRSFWLLISFFLSFSNHENYNIKNIGVYSRGA